MGWHGPDSFMCCLCFNEHPNDQATFDPDGTLVDMCPQCRITETYSAIRNHHETHPLG